jgi:hypothetical protein
MIKTMVVKEQQEDKIRGRSMNRFMVLILFLVVVYGQSYAQWERTNFPDTIKVNALAINDSTIFAGTDGEGLFVSTDNGGNWVSMNEGLQSKVIHTIFISGTTIFAGTEGGAAISTNKGISWNTIDSGLSNKGVWSFAVRNITPGDSTIFAGTWSGVYTSANNGNTWEATGLSATAMPVHSLIVHDQNIFAATQGGGVFKSQNNGFSWDNISIIDTQEWNSTTALVPVYSLAIIDTTVIASVGSGYFYYILLDKSIFAIVQYFPQQNKPILCFISHHAKLFAGNSIGNIFFSNSDGSNWGLVSSTLTGHALYSLALNNSYIYAGTESGIWRLRYPEISTTADDVKGVPTGFALEQNYPNPFNSSTKIKFTVPSSSRISLKVYNILGSVVGDLVDKTMAPGTYQIEFSPAGLPSGVFFYSLVAHEFRMTKKLILMK